MKSHPPFDRRYVVIRNLNHSCTKAGKPSFWLYAYLRYILCECLYNFNLLQETMNSKKKTPNLTELRCVRYAEIIKEPGREYLRFLADWKESLESYTESL